MACNRAPTDVPCTESVESIFSGLHALMVVHIVAAPELLLAMVDHIPDDAALLAPSAVASGAAEVHDGAGMLLLWRLVPAGSQGARFSDQRLSNMVSSGKDRGCSTPGVALT